MVGDKIQVQKIHTLRAEEICEIIKDIYKPPFVISIAGESGAGKSEIAWELSRILNESGTKSGIIQQDDYFIFPPRTNSEMRRRNIDQVGMYEVKLDFLDCNLRSFKRGESPILKPLVIYQEDRITTEEMNVSNYDVLIAEGTYTTILAFSDFRIFIDRTFLDTLEDRRRRNREAAEPFLEEVLKIESEIITNHRDLADILISTDFQSVKEGRFKLK